MSSRHSEAFELKLAGLAAGGCPHCHATGRWLMADEVAPYCLHCGYEIYPDGATAPDAGNERSEEDTGCKLAPSCLACPFEKCAEEQSSPDQKDGTRFQSTTIRYEALYALWRAGKPTEVIAKEQHMSYRTVNRAIQAHKGLRRQLYA